MKTPVQINCRNLDSQVRLRCDVSLRTLVKYMKTTINLLAAGISLAAFASAFAQSNFTKITTGTIVSDGGGSFACAWGDYDNDGFIDLFVTNVGDPHQKNFLSAIGAKVRAKATIHGKTIWQLREINSGGGICQNSLDAHFGLGDATVETMRIEWPSGTVQEFHGVAVKQFLTITEPPRLQALGRLADGSFQLSLIGGLGFAYDLQRSTDLAQWTLWTTLTNTSRTMTITDGNEPNLSQRFYRAVSR